MKLHGPNTAWLPTRLFTVNTRPSTYLSLGEQSHLSMQTSQFVAAYWFSTSTIWKMRLWRTLFRYRWVLGRRFRTGNAIRQEDLASLRTGNHSENLNLTWRIQNQNLWKGWLTEDLWLVLLTSCRNSYYWLVLDYSHKSIIQGMVARRSWILSLRKTSWRVTSTNSTRSSIIWCW